MTRQRLREGSIRWETNLSIDSFSLKIVKKVEMLAFTNKVKFIKANVPEKVKTYVDIFLKKEIDYFQKKYGYKIEIIGDPNLIIPEYIISLLNKSKKTVNKVENLNKIIKQKEISRDNETKPKPKTSSSVKKLKIELEKKPITKKKNKTPRTLWVRKKKKKIAKSSQS
jgi:hypothetical protein